MIALFYYFYYYSDFGPLTDMTMHVVYRRRTETPWKILKKCNFANTTLRNYNLKVVIRNTSLQRE